MTTHPFTVCTTAGPIQLQARDRTHAISQANYLMRPGVRIVSVRMEGMW